MTANYHTHSYHCGHASGEPREYVETAIKNGLEVLGFSDHVPYPFPSGHVSGFRIPLSETEHYVAEIRELQEEFKGQIEILIGYETEYYPQLFDGMMSHIEKFGYDYLILGQHFLKNEFDGVYSGASCDENALKQYIDQVIAAIKTGKFLYVAHPDMINYRSDSKILKREFTRLCETAIKYDTPLEFNLLGFMENRHYPCKEFAETLAETGVKTIIGCDAHNPIYVGHPDIYKSALKYLKDFGITPENKLKIKKEDVK